jgi:hypothetical protein
VCRTVGKELNLIAARDRRCLGWSDQFREYLKQDKVGIDDLYADSIFQRLLSSLRCCGCYLKLSVGLDICLLI